MDLITDNAVKELNNSLNHILNKQEYFICIPMYQSTKNIGEGYPADFHPGNSEEPSIIFFSSSCAILTLNAVPEDLQQVLKRMFPSYRQCENLVKKYSQIKSRHFYNKVEEANLNNIWGNNDFFYLVLKYNAWPCFALQVGMELLIPA